MGALQETVDRLGRALQRPVLVDDAAFRPLAHSAHLPGETDDVRVASILGRSVRSDVVQRLRRAGVAEAVAPLWLDGDALIGFGGRWCAPIRSRGCLLGFLWVIADREPAPSELEQLARGADEAAAAIREERDARRGELSPHDSLRQLVSEAPSESYAAAARLVAAGVVRADHAVVALVARAGEDAIDDTSRVLAGLGTQRFARAAGGGVLHAVWGEEAVCVVAGRDPDLLARRAPALGEQLRDCLAHAWEGRHVPTIGIGGVASSLAGARGSYEQARWAARVADRLAEREPVTSWGELGVFQLLRSIDVADDAAPESLRALFASPNADMLLETLEVYLDTGGDAQATAARLCLARGSLYYRLRRIEELAGVDLRDGGERLTLHLGLKLARLSGRWSGVQHDELARLAS